MTDLLEHQVAGDAVVKRKRRRWPWAVGAALIAGAIFVAVWFQPQKLFIDDKVVEAIPTAKAPPADAGAATTPDAGPPAAAAPDAAAPAAAAPAANAAAATPPAPSPPPPAAGPTELSRGQFKSIDHGTSGVARVLELSDGQRILRLENLNTDNGPDLFVYLTTNSADGDEGAFDDDFVNLGKLKGNQGDQNYEIPASTDLTRYRTVVIWCDRFNSAFGAADLK